MTKKVEDYALLGDGKSAALVRRDGGIEWLCWPSFDSPACFAALLGDEHNGVWTLGPTDAHTTQRRYLRDTLVLESRHETAQGVVVVTDFMPLGAAQSAIVRHVRAETGAVRIRSRLALRFDYGCLPPWVVEGDGDFSAIAASHGVRIQADRPTRIDEAGSCCWDFQLHEGEEAHFALTYFPSHTRAPDGFDAGAALRETMERWRAWVARCRYDGPWREAVVRSLIVLKALTFGPTGGIVAAATSSLPEAPGGRRNWDYRFCWLRDATFALLSLLHAGYEEEAVAWRDWLLRAVAGDPGMLQPVYGVYGDHRLNEWEADWLGGFNGAKPVRFGNDAANQRQLDAYGEVMDALFQAARRGVVPTAAEWRVQAAIVEHVARTWREPDQGMWESRGPPRRFTQSQVMAWVAVDRGIKTAEQHGLEAPLERWRRLREEMHAEICRECFDEEQGCFTQSCGSSALDAAALLIPQVGFLPPDDPRLRSTVERIRRELMVSGLVRRYETEEMEDGVGGREGVFLACSFWLADDLVLMGERDAAVEVFERVLAVRNDLGLLSEEYLPEEGRLTGNFPQALSHLSLVNSAFNLGGWGPGHDRGEQGAPKD